MSTDDLWERNAGWWQEGFTDGADAEYEEQILPLARECSGRCAAGARRRDRRRTDRAAGRARRRAGWSSASIPPPRNSRPRTNAGGAIDYARGQRRCAPVRRRLVRRGRRVPRLRAHRRRTEPAIAEIARVLEPGGRFAFFLNHPLLQAPNSGWIIDHILDEQYWRIGPYLVEDVVDGGARARRACCRSCTDRCRST